MLIYCNQLSFDSKTSVDSVFRSIAGWLKMVTKRHFTIEELKSGEEFEVSRMWVRTYKADATNPKLYSVLFSNPDSVVYGRQWITEIGVRIENGKPIYFTLLLETSDISTQVKDLPITTKPTVIKFLKQNCNLYSGTCGLRFKKLITDGNNLKAFLYEIENSTRQTPLILVSHKFDGGTYINPKTLQDHLLGLAQVVVCSPESDSWMMERVLSKRYCAWGGAINIIYPSRGRETCRNKLFVTNDLDDLLSKDVNINLELLSYITHFSNALRKRRHFSPHDVRAKRISDHRKYLKQLFEDSTETKNYEELLEEAFEQIEEQEIVLEKTKEELSNLVEEEQYRVIELEEKLDVKDKELRRTRFYLENKPSTGSLEPLLPDISNLFDTIKNPTPENCLSIAMQCFRERLEVLDSAWQSAENSSGFRQGQKLADLLYRLCTDYYELISTGPESQAKNAFTLNEFAAKESETVRNSPKLKNKRTFVYKGKPTLMLRHLKIGVVDSVQDTIRVHFHWDASNKKIVIGYCGYHLPL